MPPAEPLDYYEVLNVSRGAHPLVVTRAYRLLAALYHPDNRETGDEEAFRRVVEAARVLSDPGRRAAYDRERFGSAGRNGVGGPAETSSTVDGEAALSGRVEDPHEQRRIVLQALYDMRRRRPEKPSLPLMVVPELIGSSVEEAQFVLWYLRGKKMIDSTEDGFAITVTGVDYVEAHPTEPGASPAESPRELPPPSREVESF